MQIFVKPDWDEGDFVDGDNPAIELRFTITGVLGPGETGDILTWQQAKIAINSESPVIIGKLRRTKTQISKLAKNAFSGVASYVLAEEDEDGRSWTFDTTGGTQHITQSYQTIGKFAPAGMVAPDFGGAIGVTEDSINGVDTIAPNLSFGISRRFPTLIPVNFVKTLMHRTGRVNNAPFRGFEAGEVLFAGANGSKRGEEEWEVSYKFMVSPNATDLTVGNITIPAKEGWDQLWVLYANQKDMEAKRLVKQPIAAYVERVYQRAAFADLELGE